MGEVEARKKMEALEVGDFIGYKLESLNYPTILVQGIIKELGKVRRIAGGIYSRSALIEGATCMEVLYSSAEFNVRKKHVAE